MRPISKERHDDAIALIHQGLSLRKIASKLGIGHNSVKRIKNGICSYILPVSSGRSALISLRQENQIIRLICSGQINTATDAQKYLKEFHGVHVCSQTVANMLKKRGLRSAVKVKKPFLSSRHRGLRLAFAKKYQNWTIYDWRRVVFSDESKINRVESDGRKWCWKSLKTPLNESQITPTLKYGGGSILIWSCITSKGIGNLTKIEGYMNSEVYCQILERDLLGTLDLYSLDRDHIIFQHDNDPKHSSKKTRSWLKDHKLHILDWPPQSPDLNPIENLWNILKYRLVKYEKPASGVIELWERAKEEWSRIPLEKCLELIDSMPKRIAEVIRAKGGHTRY